MRTYRFSESQLRAQTMRLCEIDTVGYMDHDSFEFGMKSPGSGISVMELKDCTRVTSS